MLLSVWSIVTGRALVSPPPPRPFPVTANDAEILTGEHAIWGGIIGIIWQLLLLLHRSPPPHLLLSLFVFASRKWNKRRRPVKQVWIRRVQVCDAMCERKSFEAAELKNWRPVEKRHLLFWRGKVFAFLLSLLQLARCLTLEIYFLLVILRKRLVS